MATSARRLQWLLLFVSFSAVLRRPGPDNSTGLTKKISGLVFGNRTACMAAPKKPNVFGVPTGVDLKKSVHDVILNKLSSKKTNSLRRNY
jgi:hypothetical protein